jgi:hypothetical protein
VAESDFVWLPDDEDRPDMPHDGCWLTGNLPAYWQWPAEDAAPVRVWVAPWWLRGLLDCLVRWWLRRNRRYADA